MPFETSRGLIKNDLELKVEENIEDLLSNIRHALEQDPKDAWEMMGRDSIETSTSVSQWGEKFLAFFGKTNK